jgi:hypothetical protein
MLTKNRQNLEKLCTRNSFAESDTAGSSHPVTDRVGKFLWIQKKAEDVSSDVARVHSAIYQNSASMCTAM